MNSAISTQNLTVTLGKNTIIDSGNFEINKKDFVCVVGANGAGKSTLIKTILGLIKPASGKIFYGRNIKKNTIGYLPQESKIEHNFPATVFEIVLSGTLGRLGNKPFYRKKDKTRANECLKTLNIEKYKYYNYSNLSGGQKQKVLLARALAATSNLLILDEPSNSLDHDSRADLYQTLIDLNSNNDLTIIMITHDLDANDLIGNKVLAIKNGKIECKTTEAFLESYK